MKKIETWVKIYGYDVMTDQNGMVHHAVNRNDPNPTTLYPYTASRNGGWDKATGAYTPEYFRKKLREGTGIFS